MFDQDILKDIDFSKGECRLHKRGLSIDNPGDNLLLRPLCSDDYEKGKCCFCHDSKSCSHNAKFGLFCKKICQQEAISSVNDFSNYQNFLDCHQTSKMPLRTLF